jgi:hypothetical protein
VGEGPRRDAWRRLTVAQAAGQLGVSVDAVHARIKRGTIAHEREGGPVYVLLDTDQERAQGHTEELIRTLQDQLAAEHASHAEARRLLAAALEGIPPQIESPSETPGEPTEGAEISMGPTPQRPAKGPHRSAKGDSGLACLEGRGGRERRRAAE